MTGDVLTRDAKQSRFLTPFGMTMDFVRDDKGGCRNDRGLLCICHSDPEPGEGEKSAFISVSCGPSDAAGALSSDCFSPRLTRPTALIILRIGSSPSLLAKIISPSLCVRY